MRRVKTGNVGAWVSDPTYEIKRGLSLIASTTMTPLGPKGRRCSKN